MSKVRYVGPGRKEGLWATTGLTVGKEYEVIEFLGEDEEVVWLYDDDNHPILRGIKGRIECPWDEYFEVVAE